MRRKRRQIFIGDIQGCFEEFMFMLERLDYDRNADELFLTGDTINRGPASDLVLDFLLENPQIRPVVGNHEWHLLKHKSPKEARRDKGFRKTAKLLAPRWDEYLELVKSWPLYIETRAWILVHAGLLPETPPEKTDPRVLTRLRELPARNGRIVPWYDLYKGRKMVIFGHWAMNGLVRKGRARGLDTGCVYGGKLSALVLPEDRIVGIKARAVYFDPARMKENW